MTQLERILGLLITFFTLSSFIKRSDAGTPGLSYLGKDLPRGIRNNNPGNIRIGKSPWKGKVPVYQNTDGEFEQFESIIWGVRAAMKLLLNYQREGRYTIETILMKYAPPSENDTHAYIRRVSRCTGWDRHDPIQYNKDNVVVLLGCMFDVENGVDTSAYIPYSVYNEAWNNL